MDENELQKKILHPSTFMDLLANTFTVLQEVWKPILIIGSIVLVPLMVIAGLLLNLSLDQNLPALFDFTTIIDIEYGVSSMVDVMIKSFARLIGTALLLLLVVGAGYILVYNAIYTVIFKTIKREMHTVKSIFKDAVLKLPAVVLQKFFLVLIFLGIALIAGFFISIMVLMDLSKQYFPLLTILVFITAVILFVKVYYNYVFSQQAILFEHCSAFNSFSASSTLVKGYWWKVFGYLLLISVVTSFAINLVIIPLTKGAMLTIQNKIIEVYSNKNSIHNLSNEIKNIIFLFKKQTPLFVLLFLLGSMAELFIEPIFSMLLYFDLRVRKGKLSNQFADETSVDITVSEQIETNVSHDNIPEHN